MARPFSARSIFIAFPVFVVLFLWALTVYSQGDLQVGYAVIEADPDSALPVATALFSFRNADGILVSEAGVAAVEPIQRGRIFVDGGVPTGLALANPGDTDIKAVLTLRDSLGTQINQTELMLPAGQHTAQFVSELFGELPDGFVGSVTFEVDGSGSLAALTIRQGTNAHGEPLLATLPVADLSESQQVTIFGANDSIVFPHIGAGAAPGVILSTQIS